ncbi:malate dehydrogenase [Mycetocola sp.]|uniref:malate dehydrogenase n=1 Tax=Mycetocola sp. TaxID=1871042 RepID=UPI0026089006|nr:malate dehydrogenase [Mycetocola sp.]MCU1561180.1 malate dehydrogenase [Mycetocola sp.]
MTATTLATVTLTGAGGQIGYALLFRLVSGQLLGPGTRIRLNLLEIPAGLAAAEGAALELQDAAFPLLDTVTVTDSASNAFDGANVALLVGSRPRGPGMERADLLAANGAIFGPQGAALNAGAASDIRVVVVGNPANTNALIASAHAPDIPRERFTALTRLDHNRAIGLLAAKLAVPAGEIDGVSIWGNHSATQYPDVSHATAAGRPVSELLDDAWIREEFIPRVANRGAEIIEVRGSSSVGSAASATLDHVYDWVNGDRGRWTSVALPSDGSYGVPDGLVSSFPAQSIDGDWRIVQGLDIDPFSRERIDASVRELATEREQVQGLGII